MSAHAGERPLFRVPWPVHALLAATLALQIALGALASPPRATAEALPAPPTAQLLKVASLDEPILAGQFMTLYLQAFDNQPGVSVPFRELDYSRVVRWLDAILASDPETQYPLLMAAHLYAQVPDPAKQRVMLEFIHAKFLANPARRWRWLAHAALVAKHRLRDNRLALRYAADIARHAPGAPAWARQMQVFILEDMGEIESASVLLGGLLATGEVKDPSEARFLTERLEQMKQAAEKSATASKN